MTLETSPQAGCLNGWGPGGCTYTNGHYCERDAGHQGRCRCSCGATTTLRPDRFDALIEDHLIDSMADGYLDA